MTANLYALVADAAPSLPGSPLVGNNIVFYTAAGFLFFAVLMLIFLLRRANRGE